MLALTLQNANRELRADLALDAAGLRTGDDLRTAVIVSLLTERRSPTDAARHPGWWGNAYEPDEWGSRLHELRRARRSNATLLRARDYCRQALRWLIDDKVADAADVATSWHGSLLLIEIGIRQAVGVTRYSFVWNNL